VSWTCPCGCALQLEPKDLANERRMIALLGPTPRRVNLRGAGDVPGQRRQETPEPTVRGRCRNCGAAMDLFKYLADSLALHGAPWPHCEACVKGRQASFAEVA
jgi:hypothetical protein